MIEQSNISQNEIKGGYQNMTALFKKYAKDYDFFKDNLISFDTLNVNSYTNSVKITMWETTKLKLNDVLVLNKHKAVFVPSQSLRKVFIDSGITRPVEVFDGFIDDIYTYQPHKQKQKLVFGMGFNKSVSRKNEIQTINYFLEAFDGIDDVELCIKTNKILDTEDNNKIKIVYDVYSEEQMLNWYSNIDVFISLSKGEGIGMFNLESMAVGRPIIANAFLTVQDYLNNNNGYCLDYDLENPKDMFFFDCGKWSVSRKESVLYTLKYIYNNRKDIIDKGVLSSKTAERYKASISVPKLIQQLKNYV